MSTTVSVIIAAFNAEKYIAEALASVLGQTYPAVECIVVDDGSTDRTAEIVAGFGNRVRLLRQANAERSAARNAGLRCATGEYIGFLDADDILLPEKFSEQCGFLAAHREFDVVYSRVEYFRDGGRSGYGVRRPTPAGDVAARLAFGNFLAINSPLIRRAAAERVGGFDPAFSRFEDWDFFLRMALSGSRFAFLDRVHARCRVHGGNTVGDRARMFEAKWRVADKVAAGWGPELASRGIDGATVCAFHKADYGRILILHGDASEGRRLIREACRARIPHRTVFRLFSLAAGLCGSRFLAAVQRMADRVWKYRRAADSDEGPGA
ncbi:MAG TPA: glycosyltransferase [Geobacteraceae bacterium]|nr:glycosyltransferase [Geobacteraceae bacterium]